MLLSGYMVLAEPMRAGRRLSALALVPRSRCCPASPSQTPMHISTYMCTHHHHPTTHAGKFYELFEMDAHIAVEDLGLAYMKVGGC